MSFFHSFGIFCIFAAVKQQLKYKPMSSQKIDPKVTGLILKIVIYALTAIASFLGGNVMALSAGVRFFG